MSIKLSMQSGEEYKAITKLACSITNILKISKDAGEAEDYLIKYFRNEKIHPTVALELLNITGALTLHDSKVSIKGGGYDVHLLAPVGANSDPVKIPWPTSHLVRLPAQNTMIRLFSECDTSFLLKNLEEGRIVDEGLEPLVMTIHDNCFNDIKKLDVLPEGYTWVKHTCGYKSWYGIMHDGVIVLVKELD